MEDRPWGVIIIWGWVLLSMGGALLSVGGALLSVGEGLLSVGGALPSVGGACYCLSMVGLVACCGLSVMVAVHVGGGHS